MLFAYRTGKSPISAKAWRKLEAAEREAGIGVGEETASVPSAGPSPDLGDLSARLARVELLLSQILHRLDQADARKTSSSVPGDEPRRRQA